MNGHEFDQIVRKFSSVREKRHSRRVVLRSAVCGSAALGLASVVPTAHPLAGAFQATLDQGRAPGGRKVDEKAFDLALDPAAIFQFVRDEILYDPYAGILRGAQGCLWAMAGNSVDQALLLGQLLREALLDVRFVAGELSVAASETLLARATLTQDSLIEHLERLHGAVTDPPPISAESQAAIDAFETEALQQFQLAQQRWREGTDLVSKLLADAAVTLPAPAIALPGLELRQHVWVQFRDGTEWVDLDPSFAGAEHGAVFATAVEQWDELPPELHHTLAIRIHGEQISGDQITPVELLDWAAPSAELVGVPITITHVRPNALTAFGVNLGGVLDNVLQYTPNLAVGSSRAYAGTAPFSILPDGGAADLFGDASTEGDTVAEWIDVTISSPDSPPVTTTRTLFDRLPAELRASGTRVAAEVETAAIVNLGPAFGDGFLPLEQILSLSIATGEIPVSFFAQNLALPDFYADLGLVAHGHNFGRGMFDLQMAAPGGYRVYLDRPNVTGYWLAIDAVNPDEATTLGSSGLDLIQQHLAVAPIEGEAAVTTHPLLAAGVASQVVERLMLEPTPEQIASGVVSRPGVGRLMEAATAAGQAIVVLTPTSEPPAFEHYPLDSRVRIGRLLEDGMIVIAPDGPVTIDGAEVLGWWIVDPATGSTYDMMADGSGGEGAEYGGTTTVSEAATPGFRFLGLCIRQKSVEMAGHLLLLLGLSFTAGQMIGVAAGGTIKGPGAIGGAVVGMSGAILAIEGQITYHPGNPSKWIPAYDTGWKSRC
jgi:hypothetical protein